MEFKMYDLKLKLTQEPLINKYKKYKQETLELLQNYSKLKLIKKKIIFYQKIGK